MARRKVSFAKHRDQTKSLRPGWAFLAFLVIVTAGITTSIQSPDRQPDRPSNDKSWLTWLWYPVERNPTLRLPGAPAQINSVFLADDDLHGLAVGEGGTVLATTDGGETWSAQDSTVTSTLYSIYCDDRCERAWAVGSGGTVLSTRDSGKHWSAYIFKDRPARLRSVQFRKGGMQGWVVGGEGTILATSDGGKTWTLQSSDYRNELTSVRFGDDGRYGWATGVSGTMLTTSDGGKVWERHNFGSYTYLSVWLAPEGKNGWAVGYNNQIYRTTDGRKWFEFRNIEAHPAEGVWLTSVQFSADGQHGWVAREDGTIFLTVDGGVSWTTANGRSGIYLSEICFDRAGKRGLAVGSDGTILLSTDGGRNWTTQTSSRSSQLNDLHFQPQGQAGWAVGSSGTILATDDGGRHWHQETSNVDEALNSVTFLSDGRRGWAVGNRGTIIASDDGGKHWKRQVSGVESPLNAIRFDSEGRIGWSVGSAGIVLNTEDGGQTWQKTARIDNAPILTSIVFVSGQAWVTGTNGRILVSVDGGKSWTNRASGTDEMLQSIWFDVDNEHGWAAGQAGVVLATTDGGRTWSRQATGVTVDLNSVRFAPGGLLGIAAGGSGVILQTKDGGATWLQIDSKVGSSRLGVAIGQDGQTAWAIGYPPALLRTSDGGSTWEAMPWPLNYQRYPAPWFWLTLLPAALCLRMSVRADRASPTDDIEAMGTTDAPVRDFADDRLQFGPLAKGISRFLRNTNTKPPLTIAISGDWGSGKSTLMEFVCADLRRFGTRPVWFNAWHHQSEEQLLAALLNVIRDRSLPPVGSVDGLAFRLRLLTIRSKKNFILVCAGLAAVSILLGFLAGHDFAEWTRLWETLNKIGSALSQAKNPSSIKSNFTPIDLGLLLPQVLAGATALISLYKGLKAFKIDPAILLSTTAESFKLKDASAQTSFRSKFAEQFEEVTGALPFTMTIVIDDLDRCQPTTVLTVMEAVNFLVSSGKCFVMFGMATERVQAALGLAFEKIAEELPDLDVPIPAKASAATKARAARDRRMAYARDYLDKLINLEIFVPSRTGMLRQLLVGSGKTDGRESTLRIGQMLEFWPLFAVSAIAIIGLFIGIAFTIPSGSGVVVQKAAPLTTTAETPPIPTKEPEAIEQAPVKQQNATRYVPTIQTNGVVVVDRWAIGLTLTFAFAAAAGFVLYRIRSASYRVTDSRQFIDAMEIWTPIVEKRRGTPRAMRRFGNRLRYLAMLQQDAKIDETGYDELRRWLRSLTSPGTKPHRGTKQNVLHMGLSEQTLVALAAIREVYGLDWRARLQPEGQGDLEGTVRSATKLFTSISGFDWPPNAADLDAFDELLNGIKTSEAGL
ncbi:photosystem II stability/assembly factor-like uncharacterized protein [Bradyrhizobium japonicum]